MQHNTNITGLTILDATPKTNLIEFIEYIIEFDVGATLIGSPFFIYLIYEDK